MLINWIKKYKIELVILSIVIIVFTASLYLQMYGFFMTFTDTDDYMRVVRIRNFFENHDLFDNVIKRCNFPYGCSLHWTRFYDFFLIIPSYVLSFFTDSTNNAIDYVCFCIGPIIRIITVGVLLKIMHKFMNRDNAFLCLVLFAVNPIIVANGNFGRPDHHSFIVLFITLFLLKIISAIENGFHKNWIGTARISTLCIWISPETLIPLLLVDGILFLYAFVQKNKEISERIYGFLYKKSMEVALWIGLIILPSTDKDILLLGILLLAWLRNRRNINITKASGIILFLWMILLWFLPIKPILYDEISIVHFALYISVASCFAGFAAIKNITILRTICILLSCGSIFLLCYPKFIFGMGADISPYVKSIWLCRIGEMQSPFQTGDEIFFILHAVFIIAAIVSKTREIFIGKYKNDHTKTLFWVMMIVLSLVYLVFAGCANRMLLYSSLFGLPLLVDLGMNSLYTKKLHRLIRILITFFITILFIFCSTSLDNDGEPEDTPEKCGYTSKELFTEIDKLSPTPVTIMAHSNDGPAILYYTKHNAVGAPYHRQEDGIVASYEVMEDEYNEDNIKDILSKTDSAYIFIRKTNNDPEKHKKNASRKSSLSNMIISGEYPSWITIEKLPKKFNNNVVIAKINREKMK